jgi:hypothetical protein
LPKGGITPLWYPFPVLRQAKRGEGRFSEEYVFSIMDSLLTKFVQLFYDFDGPGFFLKLAPAQPDPESIRIFCFGP